MATIWTLDSCMCKLKIKKDETGEIVLDSWIQKCQIHKDITDGKLFESIITHNRIYQEDPALRETEKIRIRNLGDPVVAEE